MDDNLMNSFTKDGFFAMSFSKQKQKIQKENLSQNYLKHNHFLEDVQHVTEDLIDQKIKKKQRTSYKKSNQHEKIKFINGDEVFDNEKISPQIISLLKNCKVSIKTLQEEINLKNEEITKLSSENNALTQKINNAQKQVQRTHEILSIYMKQCDSKEKVKPFKTVSQKSTEFFQISQYQLNLKRENESLKSQNFDLLEIINQKQQQNHNFKNEILKLMSQVNHLDQKIFKMGKGVGKALSTIKKNTRQSFLELNPQSNIIDFAKNKQSKREKINGKIIYKTNQYLSDKKLYFQTPLKKKSVIQLTAQNKNFQTTTNDKSSIQEAFSPQKCQRKMEQISSHAKKIDQIDKIQSLLNKMQQLSQIEDSQDDFQD